MKIAGANIGVEIGGSDGSFDLLDLSGCAVAYNLASTAEDNRLGYIKMAAFTSAALNASNLEVTTRPVGFAGVLKPVEWSDKAGVMKRIKKVSGTGTMTYEDISDSFVGRGRYKIVGTGKWVIDAYIPIATYLGVGGSVALKANSSGGNISVGLDCYSAVIDGSNYTYLGTNGGFLHSGAVTSAWSFKYNYARLEAASGISTVKTGTKFVKLYVYVASSTGTTYVDALDAAPMGYAAFALYA